MGRPDISVLGFAIGIIVIGSAGTSSAADFGEKATTIWAPYLEWVVTNSSHDGNPFDLVAKVTFTHDNGGRIASEMFFDGDDRWKFRFTGSRVGKWRFTTSSAFSKKVVAIPFGY